MEIYKQKRFINKERIELDKRLLINYYKNKGYFNVKIESETIEFDENSNFRLVLKLMLVKNISLISLQLIILII